MAYDTSNLKNNAPGATLETSDKSTTPAGLYRHPESGQELITKEHPLFGNAQSEGIVRAGFEYVRPANEDEQKTIVEQILEGRLGAQEDVSSINKRLRELESESAMRQSEKDELAQLREEKRLRDLRESDDAGESKVDAVKAGNNQGEKLVEENGKATDNAGDTRTTVAKKGAK